MTIRVCTKCKTEKPIEEFNRRRKGLRSDCKSCEGEYKRKRNEAHPHINKNARLKRIHGITWEQFNSMFIKQEGKCAICKRHQSELNKVLCVDHNHETNENRELLCNSCNTGIGLLQEDVNTLQNAINYLKKHQSSI